MAEKLYRLDESDTFKVHLDHAGWRKRSMPDDVIVLRDISGEAYGFMVPVDVSPIPWCVEHDAQLLMDRDPILSIRVMELPCEHYDESTGIGDAWNMGFGWRCDIKRCPGGAAAFTECETCGGGGKISHGPGEVPNHGCNEFCPCPDCVGGLVGHHGWLLIQWCETHGAPPSSTPVVDCFYAADYAFQSGLVELPGDCEFVTVPIRLGSET